MFKHILQLSLLFFMSLLVSCSQSESSDNSGNQETQGNEVQSSNEQPPAKEIPYPSLFVDNQVPMIDGAYLINVKKLKNSKNKDGLQITEKSDKNFEDVKAYYIDAISKNGWVRKTDADQQSSPEQERDDAPVKYFVTKFLKDTPAGQKNYVLLINITTMENRKTTITKIIKEM